MLTLHDQVKALGKVVPSFPPKKFMGNTEAEFIT